MICVHTHGRLNCSWISATPMGIEDVFHPRSSGEVLRRPSNGRIMDMGNSFLHRGVLFGWHHTVIH